MDKFGSMRLGIVDFLGIFLPGVVWALLVMTMTEVLRWTRITQDPSPLSVVTALLRDSQQDRGTSGTPLYFGLILVALLAGYVQRSFGIEIVEPVSRLDQIMALWWRARRSCTPEEVRRRIRARLFPYDMEHAEKEYYPMLQALVRERTGADLSGLGNQPFSTCRRLLRLYAPALWDEAESREAQVRLLASLLLASLFSLAISLLELILAPEHRRTAFGWALTSLLAVLVLAKGLRARRASEVKYVYLNTLIAAPLFKGSAAEATQSSREQSDA